MTFLTARNALRTKTAESIAQLAGGEFFHFHDAKDLKAGLIAVSNDVPNYDVLNFRPTSPTPGLHALHVETTGRSRLVRSSGGSTGLTTTRRARTSAFPRTLQFPRSALEVGCC
jgi:hypothetical protein